MANFIIHDADGNIIRTGSVPDDEVQHQAMPGEFIKLGEAELEDTVDVVTNEVIPAAPPPPPPEIPEYVKDRLMAYPAPGELFDLLFKAMESGEIPKATAFFNKIKAIKLAIPKDGKAADIIVAVDPTPEKAK